MSLQRSLTPSTAGWRATAQEENDEKDQLQSQHSVLSSGRDEGELEETAAETFSGLTIQPPALHAAIVSIIPV